MDFDEDEPIIPKTSKQAKMLGIGPKTAIPPNSTGGMQSLSNGQSSSRGHNGSASSSSNIGHNGLDGLQEWNGWGTQTRGDGANASNQGIVPPWGQSTNGPTDVSSGQI